MLVQVTREKGLLVWGITIVMIYPLTLLMYTEAGRAEARYLVKWPIFVYFSGQLLGISLTFPAMWLPCVFLGHGTGATSKSRVLTAMPLGRTSRMATAVIESRLPAPIVSFMTYVCFFWDTSSYAWTLSAGLLTGGTWHAVDHVPRHWHPTGRAFHLAIPCSGEAQQ